VFSEKLKVTGFNLAGLQIRKAGERKAFGKGRLMVSIILASLTIVGLYSQITD
jgi:hypothetical protein